MARYPKQVRVSKDMKIALIFSTLILIFFTAVLMANVIADDQNSDVEAPAEGISSQDEEASRLQLLKEKLEQSGHYNDDLFLWMEQNKQHFKELYDTYTQAICDSESQIDIQIIDEFLITIGDFKLASEQQDDTKPELKTNAYGNVDVGQATAMFNKKMIERFSSDEQIIETVLPEDLEQVLQTGGLIAKDIQDQVELSYKNITQDDRFRHYNIELAIKPATPVVNTEVQQTGQDIVLILDVSQSMNGNLSKDPSYGTKLSSVKSSAKWFVLNTFMKNPDNRIGIVKFSDSGEIVSELMGINEKDEIINRIDQLTAYGESNTQAGIIMAKKVLQVPDGADVTKSDRKKSMVLLSDGAATVHYTDNDSTLGESPWKGYPEKDKKRWGFGGYENNTIIKSDIFDKPTWVTEEKAKRIAVLEAQYAVKQGIDVYTIDYSGGNQELTEYFKLMSYSLKEQPNIPKEHVYIKSYNPITNASYEYEENDNKYFIVDSMEQLEGAFETIIGEIKDNKYEFLITDSIDLEKFEIVDYPKVSHKGDTVKVEQSFIQWQINGSSDKLRTVNFTVRVVDNALFEEGTGSFSPGGDFSGNPNFKLKEQIGSRTALSFKDSQNREVAFPYMIPTVSIQPLVSGEAFVQNLSQEKIEAFILGDKVLLGGNITRGSGKFAFQWYDGDSPMSVSPTMIEPLPQDQITNPMDISIDPYKLPNPPKSGEYEYKLRLIDCGAEESGYTAENVAYTEIPVKVAALEAKITVEVVGDSGGFETSIYKTNKENPDMPHKWYFSGATTKVYSNVGSGEFKISTYVPYGYTATVTDSKNISVNGNTASFQIVPVQNSKGEWEVISPKITIKVSRTKDTPNFFDWSWGNNQSLVDS